MLQDPREYLPFLRELRSLDKYYQRFRIDDHLKRYESALKNLAESGAERFEEAMQYIEKHNLYEAALKIWRGTDRHSAVLELYGDWLYDRKELAQAASGMIHEVRLCVVPAHISTSFPGGQQTSEGYGRFRAESTVAGAIRSGFLE